MPTYWLIKAILLVALLLLAALIIRPVRSARHLAMRRLGMLTIIVFAAFAVLFPGTLNQIAFMLGIERGINLLLYALVLAFFMQMASAYRRDSEAETRITQLARALALSNVRVPTSPIDNPTGSTMTSDGDTPTTQSDASAQ